MFLLGIRAGKKGWFSDIDGHLPLFCGIVRWGLPIGFALTNYILQSVVMSTLAYGCGFGLFNQISLLTGFLLAITLYLLQISLSAWWLSHRS